MSESITWTACSRPLTGAPHSTTLHLRLPNICQTSVRVPRRSTCSGIRLWATNCKIGLVASHTHRSRPDSPRRSGSYARSVVAHSNLGEDKGDSFHLKKLAHHFLAGWPQAWPLDSKRPSSSFPKPGTDHYLQGSCEDSMGLCRKRAPQLPTHLGDLVDVYSRLHSPPSQPQRNESQRYFRE